MCYVLGSNGRVVYTGLSPGHYFLRILARSQIDGQQHIVRRTIWISKYYINKGKNHSEVPPSTTKEGISYIGPPSIGSIPFSKGLLFKIQCFTITDPCAVNLINEGVNTEEGRTTVQFTGTEDVTGYSCRLDGGRFRPCRSPLRYQSLSSGRHKLRVRPVGCSGPSLDVVIVIQ